MSLPQSTPVTGVLAALALAAACASAPAAVTEAPSPTPSPTGTPAPTATPTATPTAAASATPTATMKPTASPSPTLTATPTTTPTATPSPSPSPSPTLTATPQPTPTPDPVARGRELARRHGCVVCHSQDGSPGQGPTWKGLYGKTETLADGSTVRVDEAYLRESILDPNARIVQGFPPDIMPQNFAQKLTEEDLQALMALIESLR